MEKQSYPSIRANAVRFNQKSGIGSITIQGQLALDPDVDDPVIEIWNAVQNKMQTAVEAKNGKLIYFTPLFPKYDAERDVTTYELVPTRYEGVALKEFISEAAVTVDVFYKKLFIACFHAFLEDQNKVCNYNGYSLYQECVKKISKEKEYGKRQEYINTTKMLLGNFINFLGLPLPKSKKNFAVKATKESVGVLYSIAELNETFSEMPV